MVVTEREGEIRASGGQRSDGATTTRLPLYQDVPEGCVSHAQVVAWYTPEQLKQVWNEGREVHGVKVADTGTERLDGDVPASGVSR